MNVSRITFSILSTFDNLDEPLDTFNKLFSSVIDENAPLKRVKTTKPPAPWMKDLQVNELQKERNQLRDKAHQNRTTEVWTEF